MVKTLRVISVFVSLLAFVLLPSRTARADTIALDFTGGLLTTASPPPVTVGWSFTVTQDITVTMLGFWDPTPATPLAGDHPVGIWTSTGTLLGSATVLAGSPIIDGFRYVTSPLLALSAGQSYVIGALISSAADNFYITSATTVTTAPELTFTGSRITFHAAPTLTFPGASATPNGRFGPNFQFVQQVPEPTSTMLFAAAVLGAGVRRFMKRKA